MASIERTAYPRFKRRPTAQELTDVYTPTPEEVAFARATARGPAPTLTLLVLLKAFQRLGYFPRLQDVPFPVLAHVRSCLRLPPDTTLEVTPRTLYRHHLSIREFLQVTAWGAEARHVAITAVHQAAQAKDAPADLVNVAIEELVRQRFELPAFSALDRLVQRVRALVHRRDFHGVLVQLSEGDRAGLDALLEAEPPHRSVYNDLKKSPQRPSLAHLDQLVTHLRWLEGLGDRTSVLAGIPPAKIRHFAAEAKALDAAELKKVTPPKRYTLLLCLITRAQVQARDDLAEMFLKRLARIHRRGQEELELIRARHRETTETLVATLADLLEIVDTSASDAELGQLVRQAIAPRGEVAELRAACEAVAAYSGDNYLPLLWRFFKSHRSTLFRLARTLRLASTSQDGAVLQALDVALANEQRHGNWLPAAVDLSFASEQWQRTVLVRTSRGIQVARRPFEVCVFTSLAAELRSGDVCIQGSDAYADYRDQLLPWETCELQVAEYCAQLGIPATPEAFVQGLRTWLAATAERVDAGYPSNGQVVISEKGEPVLKRGPRRSPSASAEALEAALLDRMPERSLLDILANVHHWTPWTRHFGPLSGSEPKLDDPVPRYLLTTFAYGCNLGPAQAARHMPDSVTAHMLSFVNRRHVSLAQQDAALRDLINAYHRCDLPKVWGSGTSTRWRRTTASRSGSTSAGTG